MILRVTLGYFNSERQKSNPFYYFSQAELQRGSLKVSLDKNSFSWLHGVGDKKILE
jgi:hypothetical protein